jgi:oxygen-independent coproporphyrinogen-3 oxidase
MNSSRIALYIHIPFCRRKCGYCSFVSYQCREVDIPAYIEVLKKEMAVRADTREVGTIFFGGGTPSLLSSGQAGDIFSAIHRLFNVAPDAEITIEANPGTVDEKYLTSLRSIGVNRLSLGIQSLIDNELALLGRIHTADEARAAVRCARRAGFTNLNLDFIYGIPGQSMACWRRSLTEGIELGCEHLSLYALTLDDDVPMFDAMKRGELPSLDSDLAANHYEIAEDILAANGYQHYEISNWAKDGHECRHNLVYWHNLPYLGFGVAAHSSLNGHRFSNTIDLDTYMGMFGSSRGAVLDINEDISPELQLAESVILGLRLNHGVNMEEMEKKYGDGSFRSYDRQVDELAGLGLLEMNDGRIRLTRRGRLLGNEVFYRFLPV